MTRHVHFVGSIGLDTADEVFDAIGATVKDHVHRCPDGEVGVRRLWISYCGRCATSFVPASDTWIGGTGLCQLKVADRVEAEDIRLASSVTRARSTHVVPGFPARKGTRSNYGCDAVQVCLPTDGGHWRLRGPSGHPQSAPGLRGRNDPRKCSVSRRSHRTSRCNGRLHRMIQWDGRTAYMPAPPAMEQT
jgi:hypothetical protein